MLRSFRTFITSDSCFHGTASELEFLLESFHARLYQNIVECTRASSEHLLHSKMLQNKLYDKNQSMNESKHNTYIYQSIKYVSEHTECIRLYIVKLKQLYQSI